MSERDALANGDGGRGPAWLWVTLAVVGVTLFALDLDVRSHPQYLAAALVAGVTLVPAVGRRVGGLLDRARAPSRKVRWLVAAGLMVVSTLYFITGAERAGRGLFPQYHDEFMYLLQARMLAHGRLWMPGHPVGEFFESFFVIGKPVYAGLYFPGTALMYVPGVWAGLAAWATSAVLAGLVVALVYLVMTDLVDGVAGIVAALLVVSLEQMRVVSVMTMSHVVMLVLLLATVLAYLAWRRERRWEWAMGVGVFAGWGAITRPLDAVCLIGPVLIVMGWDLVRGRPGRDERPRNSFRGFARTIGMVAVGALPFVGMQLVLDKGVTGHWLATPIGEWGRVNQPGLTLGWGPRPGVTAQTDSPSPLPQVRDYYRGFIRPDLLEHGRDGFARTWLAGRWWPALDVSVPGHLLFALLPLGLLGIRRGIGWALVAGAVLVPLALTFWPPFLKHYALVGIAGYLLLVVWAGDALRRRWGPTVGAAFALGVTVLAVGSLPELRGAKDRFFEPFSLAHVNQTLANLPYTPAVVLFRYESSDLPLYHQEPVFNIDTAWPDDAEVIRAHDLGDEKNREIIRYYAGKEPARYFYRYDRRTGELTQLGRAKELAAK